MAGMELPGEFADGARDIVFSVTKAGVRERRKERRSGSVGICRDLCGFGLPLA
jgi:hypothetical protein